jgi:hypothetical protein
LSFQIIDVVFSFQAWWSIRSRADKNELILRRINQSKDLKQLVDIILKYSLGSAYTVRIAHCMEGEEIFGSCKWKANLAPKSEGDSHRHNHVIFSHPHVNHTIVRSGVEIEQPREDQIQGDVEVFEAPCRDGVWHIERWPPYVACSMFRIVKIHQAFLCC